jgi:hypothetical protein
LKWPIVYLVGVVVPQATAAPATAPSTTAATRPVVAKTPATTIASTVPASQPASRPVLDQSSPKALLRSFYASHGDVDEQTIRSLLHASNPVEQKVLDSRVQIELANSRLRAAEKAKFGRSMTAPSVSATMEATPLSELDTFAEKIEGDHAVVSSPRVPSASMEFVRIDGKWKLPIASLVGKLDGTVAETMGAATAAQVQIIDGLTAEVRAGKLATEEQVRAELAKRLEARIAATRAATVPTTRPATAPATRP